ncbi:MAG: hypothetical protein Q9199_005881 [Rusavskia elegans]
MPVVFFKHEVSEEQIDLMVGRRMKEDLEQTLAVLEPGCRFAPVFCKSPEEIHMSLGSSETISFLPFDGLAELCHYISPDEHYILLSKRELALSGLPTPKAQLVDFTAPRTGWDSNNINHDVARAINAIHDRQPPFVLKSNLAGGSKGTYLIHTLEDRATVEEDIMNNLLKQLPNLTVEHAHLHPFSLIMTDFLPAMPSPSTSTYGSMARHTRLASQYSELIQSTADFLRSHGYYGPAGIDVMTNKAGVHNIVDLNPRPTGSSCSDASVLTS